MSGGTAVNSLSGPEEGGDGEQGETAGRSGPAGLEVGPAAAAAHQYGQLMPYTAFQPGKPLFCRLQTTLSVCRR